jgi:hypothetical protein
MKMKNAATESDLVLKTFPLQSRRPRVNYRPLPLSAANFSRTPLGRALLHLECLCHHPAAARFYLGGLMRNLREWASAVR